MLNTPGTETIDQWLAHCRTVADHTRAELLKPQPEPPEPGTYDVASGITYAEWQSISEARKRWQVGKSFPSILADRAGTAAANAYIAALPPMTNRFRAKAFIACVAAGLQLGYLEEKRVKSLMYTAQLALAAHKPRSRRAAHPTPHRRGGPLLGSVEIKAFTLTPTNEGR